MDANEMILIRTCTNMAEAQLAKGVLDEAGIASVITDTNQAGFVGTAVAEVRLMVRAIDADRAESLLKEFGPAMS
jgi:hypothetical protein